MKAFKHLSVSNRTKCQTVNMAFIDASLVLKTTNTRANEKLSLTVWGSTVRLPAGAEVQQVNIQGKTQGIMEVDRMLTNHLANNIGMFNQRTLSREDGRGEMPTATQVTQQVAKESTLSQGQITLFYQYLDALYTQMFKRAANPATSDKEAKRFQKECEEDGVPKEALQEMEYVCANRQSGYGSPQMGMLKMQQMYQIVPMLPEDGKQNWLEDSVSLIAGPEKTARYAPRQHVPDNQDWQAAVENDSIANGRMPILAAQQNDVIHLTSHLAFTDQTLRPIHEALEAGEKDPQQIVTALQLVSVMAPHIEDHLARIENDPTRAGEAKLFRQQFQHLVAFNGKLYGAYKDAQREQQIQEQEAQQASALSALDQAKVDSVRTSTALTAAKTKSQIENQQLKTVTGLKLKVDAAQVNNRIKLQSAAAKNGKVVKAPAELTR